MTLTPDQIITDVIAREVGDATDGAYTDDAQDYPTIWGITQENWEAFYGRPVTREEMRAIPRVDAVAWYRLLIARSRLLHIAYVPLSVFMVDYAVNTRVPVAVRALQRAVGGLEVDGDFGPLTEAATNALDGRTLLKKMGHQRLLAFVAEALDDVPKDVIARTDLKYLRGWVNRLWAVAVEPL